MTPFESLGLQESLLSAISDLGFESPSEVQEKSIPILLGEETDLVALAQTGTGKTAAFGFPLLQKIDTQSRTTQGLILSPTRELCLQITNEMQLYSKHEKGVKTEYIDPIVTMQLLGLVKLAMTENNIESGVYRMAEQIDTEDINLFWKALDDKSCPIQFS